MQASLPPFHCSYLPAFSELLAQLECSLLISTYQAGKVIALSSNGEQICQLPRTFNSPMGLALDKNLLAVATKEEIVLLANSAELAQTYPTKPGCYDGIFVPRGILYTGQLAVHDLAWVNGSLVGVNTSFSCISKFDHTFSFTPVWKPAFISELQHEDRCHLNGMAIEGGEVKYATALGTTDTAQGWRPGKARDGVLMDVQTNEIILGGLPMPHSPRLINGQLLLLLSATGEIVRVDPRTCRYEVITRVNGFVRGMDCCGDYLFVTTSKLRKTHTFGDLELARKELFCGITAIHLPTGSLVAQLRYDNSCEEIYDLRVLSGIRRPNLLRHDQEVHRHAVATPEATFWATPQVTHNPQPQKQTV
ncbi:MAG TPA: TIGR03032 family protein [Verrucomicrobiae bacterium]|jgi:uncharacterized protein (TIGR03032 family)|nr:TIGR03032 family protein [Verrucomicrobiae bacterium]